MDFTERKQNRIPEYDYGENGAYFVTICTYDREKTLSQIVGDGFPVPKPYGQIAVEMIQQISAQYPSVTVDRFVIMPDHIHLLLRFNRNDGTADPSPTLGNVVGWFKYQVTKKINRQTGSAGMRIFQRSYYDHVIRNQKDYDDIWMYIENNPKRWVMNKRGYE